MKVLFLGGALEVGASCILIRINNKNILLDCGIRQGGNKDILPDLRAIQDNGGLDAVIVSHAHMDHIGALPMLMKEYPLAKIYTNNMTKDLMRVLLYDSIKVMNSREVEIPLYKEYDVEDVLNRTYTYNFETPFNIFENLRVRFYMAGHIPGASCIYITSKQGSIFYSGDFSVFSQIIVEGTKIPKLRPDVAILESTYGDKLHANRKVEEERLIEIIKQGVKNGGKILVPAFALGRAQEVLLILKKAKNLKQIGNVNIYIDGMVKDINKAIKRNPLYLRNSLCKKILKGIEPFYGDNIIAVTNKKMREDIIKSKEPCIIISSSGMITGGPSQYYAEQLLPLEQSTLVISGYQDEESPGRKVLELLDVQDEEKKIELNNKVIPVKATIEKVSLSAHSDKNEIKALNDRLSPKNLFLVHGNKDVISSLSKEMILHSKGYVYVPKVGDAYDINVNEPRKQRFKIFKDVLSKEEEIISEDLKILREFIIEKYGFRLFTATQLLNVWHGTKELSNNYIKYFQNLLIESIYFKNDDRRVFMFEPSTDSDIEKILEKDELTQTDIQNIIKNRLNKYELKKVGLQIENKKAILYFDFPKTITTKILKHVQVLKNELKWNIEINSQTNVNAMNNVITQLIPKHIIKKISTHIAEGRVELKLSSDFDIQDIKEKFKHITGFEITVKNNDKENIVANKSVNFDQNQLMSRIDVEFKYEKFKPYKKSVLKIGHMKLTFISTEAGEFYKHKIDVLSKESGWKIEVAKSYNQNEIINIAEQICSNFRIPIKKRPSFVMNKIKLNLISDISDEIFHKFKKEFYNNTLIKL